jgi:3',5'-cyclic AMP phosphodiesterase CpdA
MGEAAKGTAAADGVLRVAHITDVHVLPERRGGEGMAACLRHVQEHGKPSLIVNTGDCVMDTFKADKARADLQWELWRKVLKEECSLPVKSCLGNHDIWGWHKQRSGTTGREAQWGKRRGLDELGLDRSYYSFDHGAWHFVMLDSMVPFQDSYRARLDDEQFAWLAADLKKVDPKRPVMVGSHIPIFSPSTAIRHATEDAEAGQIVVGGGAMHMDVRRIAGLFERHPNVKLCVSGHLHEIDRAEYKGVTYVTNPAVCGAWWGPAKVAKRWGPMYTMLELRPDGTFGIEYVDYGWKAQPEVPAEKPAA